MKIEFSYSQTIRPCISLTPENKKEREEMRILINNLTNAGAKFESFSVNNKPILLNLPVVGK